MVQPPAAATILRELHETPATASGTASPLQIGFAYSDGTGREVQRKKLAEPRHPAGDGTAVPQWLCSGWVIVNNKGKPVRQYEPVFRPKHLFEFAVKEGVSPILCYDPAGRVVATLHPNHTYDKVVFTAWQQQTWDVNDTVGLPAPDGLPAGNPADDPDVRGFTTALPDDEYLPTWYQRRTQPGPDRLDVFGPLAPHEKTAAARTTKHAATPTNAHLDPLGRPVLTIAHDRAPLMTDSASKDLPWDQLIWADTHHRTHTVLDITGNQLQVDDCTDGKPGRLDGAKDRIVAQYVHDLVGSRLAEHSMEAGSRRHLADITGRPVAIWELLDDGTYRRLTTAYDKLRRPTDTVLQDTTGEKTVTRTVYGEDAPDAVANNVRGQAWKIYDGAGIVTHTYDIQGNPATTGRELAAAYRTVLDWSATPAPAVEDRTWTAATSFDALDRPTNGRTRTAPWFGSATTGPDCGHGYGAGYRARPRTPTSSPTSPTTPGNNAPASTTATACAPNTGTRQTRSGCVHRFERDDDPAPVTLRAPGSYWNPGRAGLLAGTQLSCDLDAMHRRFIETDRRRIEITQNFSLAEIDPAALLALAHNGECTFTLPELFFNLAYRGHYHRRIRGVRLTFPSVTGPYTNVGATLQLLSSNLRTTPDPEADPEPMPLAGTVVIAASSGRSDGGVFQFDFNDPLQLPFAGAGAADSRWNLVLPKEFRQWDYWDTRDVVMEISYTAKADETLRAAIEDPGGRADMALATSLATRPLKRVFSLLHDFPTAHSTLLASPAGTAVKVQLTDKHLPYFLTGRPLALQSARLVVRSQRNAALGALRLDLNGITIENFTPDESTGGLPAADSLSALTAGLLGTHELRILAGGSPAPTGGPATGPAGKARLLADILLYVEFTVTRP